MLLGMVEGKSEAEGSLLEATLGTKEGMIDG